MGRRAGDPGACQDPAACAAVWGNDGLSAAGRDRAGGEHRGRGMGQARPAARINGTGRCIFAPQAGDRQADRLCSCAVHSLARVPDPAGGRQ